MFSCPFTKPFWAQLGRQARLNKRVESEVGNAKNGCIMLDLRDSMLFSKYGNLLSNGQTWAKCHWEEIGSVSHARRGLYGGNVRIDEDRPWCRSFWTLLPPRTSVFDPTAKTCKTLPRTFHQTKQTNIPKRKPKAHDSSFLQGLDGLAARIIEFTGLTDGETSGAQHEDLPMHSGHREGHRRHHRAARLRDEAQKIVK